jgi:hypothetical protein
MYPLTVSSLCCEAGRKVSSASRGQAKARLGVRAAPSATVADANALGEAPAASSGSATPRAQMTLPFTIQAVAA